MTFTFARAFVDANGVNLPQPYSRAMEVIEIVGRDGRIRTSNPRTSSITLRKIYINKRLLKRSIPELGSKCRRHFEQQETALKHFIDDV